MVSIITDDTDFPTRPTGSMTPLGPLTPLIPDGEMDYPWPIDRTVCDPDSRISGPCPLERLSYDILERIYEYLRPNRGLRAISTTCKWVRESCKPVYFKRSMTQANAITKEQFLPSHLWMHSLTFAGYWQYPAPSPSRYHPMSLAEVFPQMPNLSRITIERTDGLGVPWRALEEILAFPRLHSFEIDDTLQPSRDGIFIYEPHDELASPPAPLAYYHQALNDYRHPPCALPDDVEAVQCVLKHEHVQRSLEQLVVPGELVPLTILQHATWPSLRVISLRGAIRSYQPLIRVFERMPLLEELSLKTGRLMLDNQHAWDLFVKQPQDVARSAQDEFSQPSTPEASVAHLMDILEQGADASNPSLKERENQAESLLKVEACGRANADEGRGGEEMQKEFYSSPTQCASDTGPGVTDIIPLYGSVPNEEYKCWSVGLKSMKIVKTTDTNREPEIIPGGELFSSDDAPVEVLLDTGTSLSYVPDQIITQLRTVTFGGPENDPQTHQHFDIFLSAIISLAEILQYMAMTTKGNKTTKLRQEIHKRSLITQSMQVT
ncbi:hypothetical protein ACG7TL_004744 [Trametes sanguinea]